LAVTLSLGVVVPLVLTLLSVIFGRGLLRAAQAVRAAGERAGEALDETQADVEHDELTPRVRVASPGARVDAARVRVAEPAIDDEEDDLHEPEPGASRRKRSGP
jgi:hypothetical protein